MPTNGLLIDTDVLSYIAWERSQAEPFAPLLLGKLPLHLIRDSRGDVLWCRKGELG